MTFETIWRRGRVLAVVACALLVACSGSRRREAVDPDVARATIENLIPSTVKNRAVWAADIFAAFEALGIEPTTENACAAIAVTQQESTFQANPSVPGLAKIARREIDTRAERYHVPQLVVNAALRLKSPNGKSYEERLQRATTERELSEVFEDFIGIVPLGRQLFADWNPVRTGGPMQVSIAYAEEHARRKRYPYPMPEGVRREIFTQRGGLYFGIAHLLDYPAPYDDMLYRFADFNAGHYASRNAAFQNAVNVIAKTKLTLDGDLLRYGAGADEPSNTELAIRKLAARLELDDQQIRRDLELGRDERFANTQLYQRVFALADDAGKKRPVPRAFVPRIKLQSAKITRNLTTEWFATRVDGRYEQCLARGGKRG